MTRLKGLLRAIFLLRWSQLRTIGARPEAKISAIFPFLGYFIIYSGAVNHLFCAAIAPLSGGNCDTAEVTAHLHLFFVGGLFFSLASILFGAQCPTIHKEYSSRRVFFAQESCNIRDYIEIYLRSPDLGLLHLQVLAAVEADIREDDVQAPVTQQSLISFSENCGPEFLNIIYAVTDKSATLTRFFVTIFYYIGFAMLAAPDVHPVFAAGRIILSEIVSMFH